MMQDHAPQNRKGTMDSGTGNMALGSECKDAITQEHYLHSEQVEITV
jgi:hypothetical protein